MTRKRLILFGLAGLLVLPWLDAPASAHNWGCWRQPNRTVLVYNSAANRTQAAAALSEWSADTILNISNRTSHTEVSVYDGNYGATGWGGLASIESSSGCNITHGHATLNTYYSYTSNGKRGVFCQEVGHLFGLQHSNDGGCMGGGYYYDINTNYNVVSHNISDIASKYANVPASRVGEPEPDDTASRVHALWYHNPRSLRETMNLANSIVVARVVGVHDAADIVVPVAGLENGERRIANQRIALQVERRLKGRVAPAIELFHTGDQDFVLDGDPPYEVGQMYLLFLMSREDGSYLVVSPEGRYEVTEGGLKPASTREFSRLLRGVGLESVVTDLDELRRRQ